MKFLYTTVLLLCLFFVSGMQGSAQTLNPDYDSTLAARLGADAYGMRTYVFVMLTSGTNTSTDTAYTDSCFASHMANINKLAEEKKLSIAGPFFKNDADYRGIFILNVTTLEEAQELLQGDAAIQEGILKANLYKWYGAAAIPLYLDMYEKTWKEKF